MEYGEFLETLEPVTLGLDQCSCDLKRSVYWSRSEAKRRRLLSSKYTVSNVGSGFFDIEAALSLSLQLNHDDGAIMHALQIDCVFRGHFHTNGPANEDHAKKFASEEAWLLFWPFFRQFVSDTTARMSIPPVVIPLALGPGEFSRQMPISEAKTPKRTSRKAIAGKGARKAVDGPKNK